MNRSQNITAMRFGKLVAIEKINTTKNGLTMWRCNCDCGELTTARIDTLKAGLKSSCGCSNITPIAERFWSKVDKRGEDECWTWKGNKHKFGHGTLEGRWPNGLRRTLYAHRISYELHKGVIPKNMEVMHKCDNPSCVNPFHLSLGYHRDNMRDMALKGRAKGPCKLNTEDVSFIRAQYKARQLPQKQLAKMFGVSASHISKIISGGKWREGGE